MKAQKTSKVQWLASTIKFYKDMSVFKHIFDSWLEFEVRNMSASINLTHDIFL